MEKLIACAAPFVEQLRSWSTSEMKKDIFYKVAKEKDQMIFSNMVLFVIQGVKLKHFE